MFPSPLEVWRCWRRQADKRRILKELSLIADPATVIFLQRLGSAYRVQFVHAATQLRMRIKIERHVARDPSRLMFHVAWAHDTAHALGALARKRTE